MAYLNVRERLIETKIAYVGAELAGKATNFDRLSGLGVGGCTIAVERTDVAGGALLALDWRPNGAMRVDDCEVVAKLFTTHGAVHRDEVDRVLSDVDGVVLVVDADPGAQQRNKESLALLRDALAKERERIVPVVVQVNKTDLPGALPVADVVSTLDVADWPHVAAAAARGDGVVETVQRAVSDVLDALKRSRSSPGDGLDDPSSRPDLGSNPLLAALKQVLRETVEAHVEELDGRLLARLGERLTVLETRVETERAHVQASLTTLSRETARGIAAQNAAMARLEQAFASSFARAHEEVRMELERTVQASAREAREHVTATSSVLRRAVEAMAADVKEVKRLVGRDTTAEVAAALARVHDGTRAITKLLEPTASAVLAMRDEAAEANARAEASTAAVHAAVGEIALELKKPTKKSWLG